MADTPRSKAPARPLSPHIMVYRWSVTMASSITHRITGVGLTLGMLLVVWGLMALASGPEAYACFTAAAGSVPGLIVLFGFAWAVSFHLLNGIRHLVWDVGYGFSLPVAKASGLAVYGLSIIFALVIFACALQKAGLL